MAHIQPFQALRPSATNVRSVASHPYDVINSQEAREIAKGNPLSFLHISKPEIDLDPSIDEHDAAVYAQGEKNLKSFVEKKWLIKDATPCYYLYQQIMGTHSQIGIVACSSVDDYQKNIIKKHELTRADKEDDRTQHIDTLNANDEPVFYTYKANKTIDEKVKQLIAHTPEYDFETDDKVRHTLWVVEKKEDIDFFTNAFAQIPYLYVADGHHRSAAASRVRELRKSKNPNHTGHEDYNFFLVVIFPDNQMQIMDYNRVVKDLNGMTKETFFEKVKKSFDITESKTKKPSAKHSFGMYIDGVWHTITAKPGSFDEKNVVERLDVSILQENLLAPLLGIGDPRKDKRINFIGGLRGMEELEKKVNSKEYAVAFSMFPTTIEDLMDLADADKIMPPKSTWFEPKLRSGLFVHTL